MAKPANNWPPFTAEAGNAQPDFSQQMQQQCYQQAPAHNNQQASMAQAAVADDDRQQHLQHQQQQCAFQPNMCAPINMCARAPS
eukprot:3940663-Pleurochrysis_carterae.AAC.1